MAIIYVHAGLGSGANDGSSWANAYNAAPGALQAALNAWTSGDVIYVHTGATSPSTETTAASVTLSSSAADSLADPIQVYGVDKDSSNAAVSNPSTVTIEATGSGSIIITASVVWHGVYLASASNDFTANTANVLQAFYNCRIKAGSVSGDDMTTAEQRGSAYFEGCIVTIGDQLLSGGYVFFKGCTVTFNVAPHIILYSHTRILIFDGCDLSGSTSGAFVAATTYASEIRHYNCKMPVSWSGYTGTINDGLSVIEFLNCDNSNDYPRSEKYTKGGDVKTDTGVYITTGGWSDETANSTGTPLSQILTPTSQIHFGATVDSLPIDAYLDSTGSKTFTVELIDDFETTLQDDEVWLEIFYHATSGQAQQSIGTSRVILGDTAANLVAGTGTANWTGEPASSRSVKVAATVTTGNIGWYSAVVRLAKYEVNGADAAAGAALYVAPLLTVA